LVCIAILAASPLSRAQTAATQCTGRVGEPSAAAECTANRKTPLTVAQINPATPYHLDELIDIAESNNPTTRVTWERAKQAAENIGIARSAYYPRLAARALFSDERFISPAQERTGITGLRAVDANGNIIGTITNVATGANQNPNQLMLNNRGYTMVILPQARAGLALNYNIFDFGRRRARLDIAKEQRLAAVATFQRSNQDVAFRVVTTYYGLVTAKERINAIRQILETARATLATAEAQLANGRGTIPDVLNARASVAQATYDLEAASGDEAIQRVRLREVLGLPPSEAISIALPEGEPDVSALANTVQSMIEAAGRNRPDIEAFARRVRIAEQSVKLAKAAYMPTIDFSATGESVSYEPKPWVSVLGNTTQATWSARVNLNWDIFDGGLRKHNLRAQRSQKKASQEELRGFQDQVTREAWNAYIQLRTAGHQQEAAKALLTAALTGRESTVEAYENGVKNLVDLVTADSQLARARLALVQARSAVWNGSVNLSYSTGELLRQSPGSHSTTKQP